MTGSEISEDGHTKLFAHFANANGGLCKLSSKTTAILLIFLLKVNLIVDSIVRHWLFIVRQGEDLAVIEFAITTVSVWLRLAARRARRAASRGRLRLE